MIKKYKPSFGYKYLNTNFNQIEENIDNDRLLIELDKQNFYDFLSKLTSVDINLTFKEKCCNEFFYKKQLLGSKEIFSCKFGNVATSEDLKITKRKTNFALRSSRILSREKSLDDFEELINGVLNINDIKRKFSNTFRQYTIWLFKDPDDKPFKNTKYLNKDLRSLLGLGHISEDVDLFGVIVNITNEIEIYKPTAFDAEFNVYWRPGGYTLVLKDILNFKKNSKGLQEFVSHGGKLEWQYIDEEIFRLN